MTTCNKDCFNCQYGEDCVYDGTDTSDIDLSDNDVGVIRSRQYINYKRYVSTEKGKEALRRYRKSEKGRQARIRVESSDKRKQYLASEERKAKQKEYMKRHNQKESAKAKKRESNKLLYQNEDFRKWKQEYNKNYNQRPEVKERNRLAQAECRKRKKMKEKIKVSMIASPSENDWMEVKRRALVTVGKNPVNHPTEVWKESILRARHSPIRHLQFSFYIECPYWVSVHLCRHVHAQPYVSTQRNDRQSDYDRDTAPQNEMVKMIWDMNAETLITIANKRLCNQASAETQEVVLQMCKLVNDKYPEFRKQLVPMCVREGSCNEIKPCGKRVLMP